MTKAKQPIPVGYHNLTPTITVHNAREAIEFYKKAFGAEEREVCASPDGKVMHAEIKIGDSILMLSDEFPQWDCKSPQTLGGTPTGIYLYVENVDHVYKQAIDAGAKVKMPIQDQFWGDRSGHVVDPFGHMWTIATRLEDLTMEEIEKRKESWLKQMAEAAK